jgi:hypothetical protein
MDDLEATDDGELPYEDWTEEAFRGVAVRALAHTAAHGLPGDHHFYITFRVDHPGTSIPARLRAKYPEEMTIVLQHKFWDLLVDEAGRFMSVGLSFGGAASTLVVPFDAITAFADPSVKWGLRFRAIMPGETPGPGARDDETEAAPDEPAVPAGEGEPQVVSLDAFRRRKD